MSKGIQVTLYNAGGVTVASLADIAVMWFDGDPAFDLGNLRGKTTAAATSAGGVLTLNLENATTLELGEWGFLVCYKMDGADWQASPIFASRMQLVDVTGGDIVYAVPGAIFPPGTVLANLDSNPAAPQYVSAESLPLSAATLARLALLPTTSPVVASYTLQLSDAGGRVLLNNGASAHECVIPDNTTEPFPVNTTLYVQKGNTDGVLTLRTAPNVTLLASDGVPLVLNGSVYELAFVKDAIVWLAKIATNSWRILLSSGFTSANVLKIGDAPPAGNNLIGDYMRMDFPFTRTWYRNGVAVDQAVTWAARPAPSLNYAGLIITIHDPAFGIIRTDFQCLQVNGTWQWVPLEPLTFLMRDPSPTLAFTTSAQWNWTQTLPNGLLYPGCEIGARGFWNSAVPSTVAKTWILRVGASSYAAAVTTGLLTPRGGSILKHLKVINNTTVMGLASGNNDTATGPTAEATTITGLNLSGTNLPIAFGMVGGAAGDSANLVNAAVTLTFPRA